ncbi:MAG: sigma-70 family RNA polymerase sigma factor [Gemmatimonadetes bacterium]|uniref:Sigma-70 family RNA polymerase sigma factor n=1 Tax=Candidatus Kutchimonas denitrificans TaxID=3056748 RepID=A0AAE4ZAS3_9BACT|nr:sigma-70 family RNA polymerase sigma factor [Gemmatimonadota bacterium]NIR74681.1 sigma-70 family RNA polymerase sigma factor [Candidatus Kutchimonas denitrificans]NIS01431.1 sigma-70 family RNA polymerase sigma factor [Gemmatimonadota bacterium]NIT67172.1 sigma-70 family RNA polymerase sigma factor [Gemmatimonadota bacterium]NIU52346.1 sigma-70 family RNA polymerase sigma factor [Gemmatimonadota bacterium]
MNPDAFGLESALVSRARTGDEEALEAVFHAYRTQVYNLGRRICGNEEDAEDVLQDTFLEVCRSINRFRGDGSLWGWVRRVAASKAFMLLRRERIRSGRTVSGDGLSPDAFGVAPREPTGPIDLEAALSRLSPVTRAVLWLHDVEGYTHEEIGELMEKTASFSKSQLSRAHRRLREWLG